MLFSDITLKTFFLASFLYLAGNDQTSDNSDDVVVPTTAIMSAILGDAIEFAEDQSGSWKSFVTGSVLDNFDLFSDKSSLESVLNLSGNRFVTVKKAADVEDDFNQTLHWEIGRPKRATVTQGNEHTFLKGWVAIACVQYLSELGAGQKAFLLLGYLLCIVWKYGRPMLTRLKMVAKVPSNCAVPGRKFRETLPADSEKSIAPSAAASRVALPGQSLHPAESSSSLVESEMERSPVITFLFHIRAICLLTLLGTLDSLFIHKAYYSILNNGASTQLVFGFEYAILLTIVVAVFMKYALHTIDLQSDNPWENKAVYILYSELMMGFIKSLLYISFMVIMIRVHTFPLFAIRPMYLTLRSFKKSVTDVIMSRRAILNMNTLYPDATADELVGGDNVCIICREEMVSNCKKLPCNHIFHTSCLRSWFQRQQTCPTCRMNVLQSPQRDTRPAQVMPPAPGAPPVHGPPPIPPPFPMFPMGFPPVPQPGVAGGAVPTPTAPPAGTTPSNNGNGTPAGPSNPTSGPSSLPPFIPPFPMMFPPPPMFGFPFVAPPTANSPNVNLSSFSPEELSALEGQERHHVEARIAMLRNIHSLLDTAILQLNQYSQLLSTTTSSFNNGTAPGAAPPASGGSTGAEGTESRPVNIVSENVVGSSADAPGPSWATPADGVPTTSAESASTDANSGEPSSSSELTLDSTANDRDGREESQNDIRRRRIQRFSSEPNAPADRE